MADNNFENQTNNNDVQAAVTAALDAEKKKKKKKKWIIIAVVVFVLIIIGVAGSGGSDDDSSDNNTQSTTSSVSSDEKGTTKEDTTEETTISKDDYINQCEKIAYKDLARDPDKYEGKKVKFTGEVIQVVESSWSDSTDYRVAVTKDEYGYNYDDVVYVEYERSEGESRVLEDDIITFYGEFEGLYSYTSTMGGKITIPQVNAEYIEIQQ